MSSTEAPKGEPIVWRPRPVSRWAALTLAFALYIPAVLVIANARDAGDLAFGSILIVLSPIIAWRFAWFPYIRLTSATLEIQNPFRHSIIELADINSVDPGYSGLSISLRNGRAFTAWAVQRTNLAKWSGRATRAAEVARIISERAGRASELS